MSHWKLSVLLIGSLLAGIACGASDSTTPTKNSSPSTREEDEAGASEDEESGAGDDDEEGEEEDEKRDAGKKKDAGKPTEGEQEPSDEDTEHTSHAVDAGKKTDAGKGGRDAGTGKTEGDAGEKPSPGGGSGGAKAFCAKYGEHCGYAKPNRHADEATCLADYDATPAQQGCKNMHMDTSIAGTAAACNGMPSEFCFSIHCLHVAGIKDPTGVTYCK